MRENKKPKANTKAKKTEGNNQWTSNNTKYYPDNRERSDGPGGENSK